MDFRRLDAQGFQLGLRRQKLGPQGAQVSTENAAAAPPELGFHAPGVSGHGAKELDIALVEEPDHWDSGSQGSVCFSWAAAHSAKRTGHVCSTFG